MRGKRQRKKTFVAVFSSFLNFLPLFFFVFIYLFCLPLVLGYCVTFEPFSLLFSFSFPSMLSGFYLSFFPSPFYLPRFHFFSVHISAFSLSSFHILSTASTFFLSFFSLHFPIFLLPHSCFSSFQCLFSVFLFLFFPFSLKFPTLFLSYS